MKTLEKKQKITLNISVSERERPYLRGKKYIEEVMYDAFLSTIEQMQDEKLIGDLQKNASFQALNDRLDSQLGTGK